MRIKKKLKSTSQTGRRPFERSNGHGDSVACTRHTASPIIERVPALVSTRPSEQRVDALDNSFWKALLACHANLVSSIELVHTEQRREWRGPAGSFDRGLAVSSWGAGALLSPRTSTALFISLPRALMQGYHWEGLSQCDGTYRLIANQYWFYFPVCEHMGLQINCTFK